MPDEENFGLTKFEYTTLYPACLMLAGVLMISSIDIYLPAGPLLRSHFDTSEWMIQFSMMQTPIVAALVGLLYGHLSDTKGRRPAMISSLGIFSLCSFLCSFSWNIESFLVFRFLQAFGAGGISVVSISVLADMFSGALYARYMATYSMSFPIMFAVAPVVGSHLLEWFGWESTFWFLGGLSASLWLVLFKKMPETHKNSTDTMGWGHILENMKTLTSNRNFMIFAVCHGLPVAISAVYSANSSFIFIDGFNFLPTTYAYIQLIPVFVNLMGSIIYRHRVLQWGIPKCIRFGMYLSIAFLVLTILGMIFGVMQLPWPIVMTMCVLNLSLSSIIASSGTKAVECAPHHRGLAVAYLGLLRNGVVAALVLIVAAFFNGTILPVYIGMAILTTALIILIWPHSRDSS
jgi:DHA1 family bicyclomycin/chloramphenicol resistance-like MFS transporter